MKELELVGAHDGVERLQATEGETIRQALLRHGVPPQSVVVFRDGDIVSENVDIDPASEYRIQTLEGYNLNAIRSEYRTGRGTNRSFFSYRRMSFEDGVEMRHTEFDRDEFQEYLEQRVAETIRTYDLIEDGDSVLLALSGGIDSSTLLILLDSIRNSLPEFAPTALTITEPTTEDRSPATEYAEELAEKYGVEHVFVTAEDIRQTYGLNEPLPDVLSYLGSCDENYRIGTIVDSINRTVLERRAVSDSFDTILVGAHVTELVGGILRSLTSGVDSEPKSVIRRTHGPLVYAHPLAFTSKKELWLYHCCRRGVYDRDVDFEPWSWIPTKQSFFYFMADMMQEFWPGIEHWLYEAHNQRQTPNERAVGYGECENCGKLSKRSSRSPSDPLCYVCSLFVEHGFVDDR